MKAKAFFSQLGGKLGVGLCLAGFLFMFLGWNGAASVDRVASQFPYLISGGLVGLSLVVIGVGMIVVQSQRADRASLQASIKEFQRAVELASGLQTDDDAAGEFRMPPARPTPQHVVDTIAAGGSGATDSASRQGAIEVLDDHDDHDGDADDETGVLEPDAEQAPVKRPRRRGPLTAEDR